MELAAIGWGATPVISLLILKVQSFAEGQYRLKKDMKNNLDKLETTLTEILGVVAAMDKRTIDDHNLARWLNIIKDAVYEAEDVIDEFEYRIIEKELKKTSKNTMSKLAISYKFGHQVRDDLPDRVGKVQKKLKKMKKDAHRFHQSSSMIQQQYASNYWDVTSSHMAETEREIFGRERQKKEILSLLLRVADEPEASERGIPPVISLNGVGGVGKTTLAQLLYNDNTVKDRFSLRMWICVSENFDLIKLTKEMLDAASKHEKKNESEDLDFITSATEMLETVSKHDKKKEKGDILDSLPGQNENFDSLQAELQSKLMSKRFLLVLDDVWVDERRKPWQNTDGWKRLFAPLKYGAMGCKILVTTRMEMVAEILDAAYVVPLEGLAGDEDWLLFKHHAFGNKPPANYYELEEIGRKIIKKQNGSPLAAKVLGSMLKDKSDANFWREILERDTFDDIKPILRISYERLPEHLKPCFVYCSLFPKGWRFAVDDLVHLWMAQGYVQPQHREHIRVADIGKNYFSDLLARSFFQTLTEDSSTFYVMHDLMHELAQSVSANEYHKIEKWKEPNDIPPVRHLSIFLNDSSILHTVLDSLRKSNKLYKLRTLIISSSRWWKVYAPLKRVLSKLRSVRVLAFYGDIKISLPDNFGHLLHLRFLYLQNYFASSLPKSVSQLYHLQALLALGDARVVTTSLQHLNNLNYVRGRLQFLVPHGLLKRHRHKPKQLRETELFLLVHFAFRRHINCLDICGLQGTRFPSWIDKKWCSSLEHVTLMNCGVWVDLPPLGHLPSLKELAIIQMPNLKQIGCEFYGSNSHENNGFPSLETLLLADMPQLSEWSIIKSCSLFPCLSNLIICNCPKLKQLPLVELPLPPMLKEMIIRGVGPFYMQLQNKALLLRSIVPSKASSWLHQEHLQAILEVTIKNCHEDATFVQGIMDLVSVKKLTFQNCSRLLSSGNTVEEEEMELEEDRCENILPMYLESLEIWSCGFSNGCLSRCLQGLKYLSKLMICHCTTLTSLPSAEILGCLVALRKLYIDGCGEIASLDGLHALDSLTELEILWCRKLKSLSLEPLSSSVQSLEVWDCHPELMRQLEEKTGPGWEKISHIPYISIR